MVIKVLQGFHRRLLRGLVGVSCTTHHLLSLNRFGRYSILCVGKGKLTGSGSASAMSLALRMTTQCFERCLMAHPSRNPESLTYACCIICLAGTAAMSAAPVQSAMSSSL